MTKYNGGTLAAVRNLTAKRTLSALMAFGAVVAVGMTTVQAAHAEYSFDTNRTTVTGNSAG